MHLFFSFFFLFFSSFFLFFFFFLFTLFQRQESPLSPSHLRLMLFPLLCIPPVPECRFYTFFFFFSPFYFPFLVVELDQNNHRDTARRFSLVTTEKHIMTPSWFPRDSRLPTTDFFLLL